MIYSNLYNLNSGTNNLKTMEKYLPSEEEKEALKEYEGDISKLSDVEQYLIKLIEVEDYELRIQIGIMKSTYEEKLEDLLSAAKNYETICKSRTEFFFFFLSIFYFNSAKI